MSPILSLWDMSFLTRDLIHERNNAALQGRPYAHECFHEPKPIWLVTKSSIYVGKRAFAFPS